MKDGTASSLSVGIYICSFPNDIHSVPGKQSCFVFSRCDQPDELTTVNIDDK